MFQRLLQRLSRKPQPVEAPPRLPFCQLTELERSDVNRGVELLAHYQDLLQRLQEAQASLWWRLRQRYGLDDNVEYDPASGQIFQALSSSISPPP